MSRQQLNALVDEIARTTDPRRREELIAKLRAGGVTVCTDASVQEQDEFVPRGCVKGGDGIIRNPNFAQEYRREVEKRLGRGVRCPARRPPQRTRVGRRVTRTRARTAHGPPRKPDDPPPEPPLVLAGPPSVHVRLYLEGEPEVRFYARTDEDAERLKVWLEGRLDLLPALGYFADYRAGLVEATCAGSDWQL